MKDSQNMQVMKITLVMIIEGFYNNRDCVDSGVKWGQIFILDS